MSPNWNEMRRWPVGTLPDMERPKRTRLQKYVLPEDRPQVMAAVRQASATKSLFARDVTILMTAQKKAPDAQGGLVARRRRRE